MTAIYPRLTLASKRLSDHPWIFARALKKTDPIANGSISDLFDEKGAFLARGFYNGHARVGFRSLSNNETELIDRSFFERRLKAAFLFRQKIVPEYISSGHYRFVNSEGDRLSGLIIDIYGTVAVVELFSKGYLAFKKDIESIVSDLTGATRFSWFAEKRIQKQESFDLRDPAEYTADISEEGISYQVSTSQMHKTGFYLDQRENRKRLTELCDGKIVADLCCFAGTFGIAAKKMGNAKEVVCVDMDPAAIELGQKNAENNAASVSFACANVSDWAALEENKGRFDVVVLDPPKLTKNSKEIDKALRRYTHLNAAALDLVAPGGILVTCSCTGLVSEDEFLKAVRRAAFLAGRSIKVFRTSGASADHPFAINCPEGRYLKVVWAAVD